LTWTDDTGPTVWRHGRGNGEAQPKSPLLRDENSGGSKRAGFRAVRVPVGLCGSAPVWPVLRPVARRPWGRARSDAAVRGAEGPARHARDNSSGGKGIFGSDSFAAPVGSAMSSDPPLHFRPYPCHVAEYPRAAKAHQSEGASSVQGQHRKSPAHLSINALLLRCLRPPHHANRAREHHHEQERNTAAAGRGGASSPFPTRCPLRDSAASRRVCICARAQEPPLRSP
jgi:hypothetical protein